MNLPRKDKKFCIHRICYLDQDAKDYHGYYTGYPLNKITGIGTELPIMYPSGGSGFILSKSACIAIQGFLKSITDEQIPRSGHSDVTIGFLDENVKY